MRIGMGFDLHRLVKGRKFILGGVEIPHSKGLLGHSDGDCLTHAVIDAILGAAGMPDIGEVYPDTSSRWKGASSLKMLELVMEKIRRQGWQISNLDSVISAEEPKLAPHKEKMRSSLARALEIDASLVNLKAKTMEGLGPVGKKEAVSAMCVVLLAKGTVIASLAPARGGSAFSGKQYHRKTSGKLLRRASRSSQ